MKFNRSPAFVQGYGGQDFGELSRAAVLVLNLPGVMAAPATLRVAMRAAAGELWSVGS